MSYPKIVYHKDYVKTADEKERESKTKKVKSEEEHKRLGADWGSHPALKAKVEGSKEPGHVEFFSEEPVVSPKRKKKSE